jgi:hypothetical protein
VVECGFEERDGVLGCAFFCFIFIFDESGWVSWVARELMMMVVTENVSWRNRVHQVHIEPLMKQLIYTVSAVQISLVLELSLLFNSVMGRRFILAR